MGVAAMRGTLPEVGAHCCRLSQAAGQRGPYVFTFADRGLLAVFLCVGLFFMSLRAQLLCTTHLQFGLLEAVKLAPTGFIGGWMSGYLMGVRCLRAYVAVYTAVIAVATFLAVMLGRINQVPLFNAIGVALISGVVLPCARRPSMGTAFGLFAILVQCMFSVMLAHMLYIKSTLGSSLQGLLTPCLVSVYHAVAQHFLILMWTWTTPEIDAGFFDVLAAYVIQNSEAMRYVGLLSAVENESRAMIWLDASLNLLLSIVCDTLLRCRCAQSLMSVLQGRPLRKNSNEMDALLRCYFVFSYTPLCMSVGYLAIGAATGLAWVRSWDLAALVACALVGEVLSDALTVLLQCWLHGWRPGTDAFLRLQRAGQHLPLSSAWPDRRYPTPDQVRPRPPDDTPTWLTVVPIEAWDGAAPDAKTVAGGSQQAAAAVVEDAGISVGGWRLMEPKRFFSLVLAVFGCLNISRALESVFGPCGFSLPGTLCS